MEMVNANRKRRKMRPFFKHFGAKYRLSSKLPPPRYKTIIEPFAGSACYSTMYGENRDVVLCDLDPQTAAIWKYLIQATPSDIMALPGALKEITDIRKMGLSEPEQLLLQRWMTPQGSRSNYFPPKSCLKLMEDRTKASSFWGKEIRDRIAHQVSKIKHWTIVCDEWKTVCGDTATYLFDPPYQKNKHSGVYGKGKNNQVDFNELADACMCLPGQIIVHEQSGADWLPFETLESNALTGARQKTSTKRQHEVVFIKDNAPVQQRLF